MSRVGNLPIEIPPGITLEKNQGEIIVRGTKGVLSLSLPTSIDLSVEADKAYVKTKNKNVKNLHGLIRTLINNAIIGTTKGWEKTVELVGVGYRVAGGGNEITLTVGFSHPVKFTAPKDIVFNIKDNTKITISGIDKQLVGEVAARIRSVRPPEPYKGKGIRYAGEIVRKKAGKAVKTATTS